MSGSLIKIAETTVSSAVASVTLTGIDSTYDVYMFVIENVVPTTNNDSFRLRVTKSGTEDSTANYDYAFKNLRADTTFTNNSGTNGTYYQLAGGLGNATGEAYNDKLYLFNFPTSEYSFATLEGTLLNHSPNLFGGQGGFTHTVGSASDGVKVYFNSGNIDTGSRFVLYGLKK